MEPVDSEQGMTGETFPFAVQQAQRSPPLDSRLLRNAYDKVPENRFRIQEYLPDPRRYTGAPMAPSTSRSTSSGSKGLRTVATALGMARWMPGRPLMTMTGMCRYSGMRA